MNLPEPIPLVDRRIAATVAARPMIIGGMGTAVPPHSHTQTECFEALKQTNAYRRLESRSQALLRKLLAGNNGIHSRSLALAQIAEVDQFNPDTLQQHYERNAPRLGIDAAQKALIHAAIDANAIDAVLVSTCTGYLCPGLSSYLIEGLGLRSDVIALDLVGNGCGAALPNLHMAQTLLAAGSCERVLSVCVEVCTAAFYLDNDPGVLISACLFGDGAAALVLGTESPPNGTRRIAWTGFASETAPTHRELLRFEHRHGMLRNVLTPPVPRLAAQYAERVLDRVLDEQNLRRSDIQTWIWHAGGRDVLTALRERLGLNDDATRWSAAVLSEHGNLSSPSVIFALEKALAGGAAAGAWWLSSFGAGFSCFGALLQVS
jgi:alkylresorcinol/alkylpyrone synthase